jgi:hypothetical protein
MQPVRTIAAVLFAAAILATGCAAHTSTDQPPPTTPNLPGEPRLPIYRSGPAPIDRQAPIYAAVLRQYLTSGGGHHGGDAGYGGFRFPQVFVLDHAAAGVGVPSWQAAADGALISPAVRRAITQALADVGPVTFVPSPDSVVDHHGCSQVRDQGILVTLGSVDGIGEQVQVGVYGFVACLGANSLIYRVEQTSGDWKVAGVAVWGAVS